MIYSARKAPSIVLDDLCRSLSEYGVNNAIVVPRSDITVYNFSPFAMEIAFLSVLRGAFLFIAFAGVSQTHRSSAAEAREAGEEAAIVSRSNSNKV